MSGYDTSSVDPETVRRLFSHPMQLPDSFKTWMIDQLTLTIPDLPVGQAFQGRNLTKQIKHDATAVTGTATSETTLFSADIKGGLMGKNGRLVLDSYYKVSCNDASNSASINLYLGGALLATQGLATAYLDSTLQSGMARWIITNNDSYASQRVAIYSWLAATGVVGGLPTDGGLGSGTVDTKVDNTLALKIVWASGGSQQFVQRLSSLQLYNPVAL